MALGMMWDLVGDARHSEISPVAPHNQIAKLEVAMPSWLYERGENRRKHCGHAPEAHFVPPSGRGMIGKCPSGLNDAIAEALLRDGIPFFAEEQDPYPKHIFNVYQGVVYEAAPTRPGISYHGYPWKGWIPDSILEELEQRANAAGDGSVFKRWVKEYRR